MNKSDKKTIIILKVIFIAVGLVMISGAVIISLYNRKFFKTAEKTTAVITDIEVSQHWHNGKKDSRHTVYVTYEVDGVQYDNISLGYYSSGMFVGKTINIYYKKNNPGKVKTKGIAVDSIVLGGLGAAFLVVGIILVCAFSNKSKKIKQNGVRYIADIINITLNESVRLNGRHPYIVDCQVVDAVTGATSLYRSRNIYEDISVYGLEKVPVYVDNNNPAKYYVDIEEAVEWVKKQNNIQDYR